MKNTSIKPKLQNIIFSKFDVSLHDSAQIPFEIWGNFNTKSNQIEFSKFHHHHKIPLPLIKNKTGEYFYFCDFERMLAINTHERNLSHLAIIYDESEIETLNYHSWKEVFQLPFLNQTIHFDLHAAINKHAPQNIKQHYLQSNNITQQFYCDFAGISLHKFTEQKRRLQEKKQSTSNQLFSQNNPS